MAFQQGQMPDEKLALDAVNRFLLPPFRQPPPPPEPPQRRAPPPPLSAAAAPPAAILAHPAPRFRRRC